MINGVISGLDWFPTIVTAAGYEGDIVADLKKGKTLNGQHYKVHLAGYNQLAMLTKGDKSARNEFWYFTESTLAAARIGDFKYTFLDQPPGWFGPKVKLDWPGIVNLRTSCGTAWLALHGCDYSLTLFRRQQATA